MDYRAMVKRMKPRKVFVIILALILLAGGIWGIGEVYLYYHPEVIITYSDQESEDQYLSLPMYLIVPRSRFGNAARFEDEMKEWALATNEITEWIYYDLEKPKYITSKVEIVDGKTVITYQGTAVSAEGDVLEIDREIVLDFVVSRNLPEPPQ